MKPEPAARPVHPQPDLGALLGDLGAAGVARWMTFAREVGEARSLAAVGQLTARVGLEIAGARSARVLLASGGALETVAVANRQGISSLGGSGLAFETLPSGGEAAEALAARSPRASGERAWLPLTARDRAVGVLELLGASEDGARRLLAFASPAALALEGARLGADLRRREREARTLADFSRRIGETLELPAILERTLEFAARSVSLERGLLALYDEVRESTAVAREVFAHGFGEALAGGSPSLTVSVESFERLVVRGRPIVLNDVQHSSRSYAASARALGAEAFVMVPLAARGRPLGVLYLDTTRPGVEVREREVALLQAIAEQASLAVENARLYAEESRKLASAEALREVVLALGSSLDLSIILERILGHSRELLGAGACAVYELDGEGTLAVRAALGMETELVRELRFPDGSGAIGQAVREERPVAVHDLATEPFERPEAVRRLLASGRFPYAAMLGLPLAARGRVFGGLALYWTGPRDFAEADVALLELFAGHAAVALENARLFEEEVRREREAEVLLRVARLAGATLELDEVLARVAAEVGDALDLERCFLGFFDAVGEDRAELGRLWAHGFGSDLEAFRPFVVAEEAYERLLLDREPIVWNDLASDATLSDQGPALLSANSCVIAPLVAQGQVLGLLYADTVRSGRLLTEREADLAAAIADQAALAIQNARLFERTQAQEAQYRLLAEAAHDMIVTSDLEGCVTYANPAVGRVLGYGPGDLVGRPYSSILEPEAAAEEKRAWRSVLDGAEAAIYEGPARRRDGSTAYLEVNLNPLRVNGETVGSLAIARDLSGMRQLAEEIGERGQALAREAARALELRTYLSLFTQAQEEERRRIARELHDDTAQTLVAIARRLDRLGAGLPEEAQAKVADIRGDLDFAIDSVRRFSRNLRPSVLDDLGLLPALEWLAGQARTETRLEISGAERRLSPDLELTLFRVVQEALTNVDKHARATSAAVRVEFQADGALHGRPGEPGVAAIVRDDGAGFSAALGEPVAGTGLAPEGFAALAAAGHLGLAGMRERVALAGGELRLETAPGRGSSLGFWFPA